MSRPILISAVMAALTLLASCQDQGQPDFLAPGSASLTVRILDEQGEPATNCQVFLTGDLTTLTPMEGSEGVITYKEVSPGTAQVLAWSSTGAAAAGTARVLGNVANSITLHLTASAGLQGVVTDQSGIPIPGAVVLAQGTPFADFTDTRGRYHLTNLPPACFSLTASDHQTAGTQPNLCLKAGELKAAEPLVLLPKVPGNQADEQCDGEDNNGNGRVDEDLVDLCQTESELCPHGLSQCINSNWTPCQPPATCKACCTTLECGDDGCGGSCGDCTTYPNSLCTDDQQCACQPDCEGRECGPDGCGGTCGQCPADHVCTPQGQCDCVPDCTDKICGDDGCGGSCGECPEGQFCDDGFSCRQILAWELEARTRAKLAAMTGPNQLTFLANPEDDPETVTWDGYPTITTINTDTGEVLGTTTIENYEPMGAFKLAIGQSGELTLVTATKLLIFNTETEVLEQIDCLCPDFPYQVHLDATRKEDDITVLCGTMYGADIIKYNTTEKTKENILEINESCQRITENNENIYTTCMESGLIFNKSQKITSKTSHQPIGPIIDTNKKKTYTTSTPNDAVIFENDEEQKTQNLSQESTYKYPSAFSEEINQISLNTSATIITYKNKTIHISHDPNKYWETEKDPFEQGPPVSLADNNTIIYNKNAEIWLLEDNGNIRWTTQIDCETPLTMWSPIATENKIGIMACKNKIIGFHITSGLADSAWPRDRGGNENSGWMKEETTRR